MSFSSQKSRCVNHETYGLPTSTPLVSDYRHTVPKAPFRRLSEQYRDEFGQGFQWSDEHRNLHFAAWGTAAELGLRSTSTSQSNEKGSRSIENPRDLFTQLRTMLPGEFHSLPLGYFANRFDTDRCDGAETLWASWPQTIFCLPRVVIVQRGDGVVHEFRFGALPVNPQGYPTEERQCQNRKGPTTPWSFDESKNAWVQRVTAVERACQSGQIGKVVLAHSATRRLGPTECLDVQETMVRLRTQNSDSIVFCLPWADACFVGATPEILAELDAGKLKTHALAGTIALHGIGTDDHMLTDTKLIREHACVVDELVAELKGFCSAIVVAPQPTVRRLRTMAHLQTPIQATVTEDISILDVARRLHPTPALAGAPRRKAMTWLRESEPLDRGYYGGPIGLFNARGEGICAVAIRSGLMTAMGATAFAGAGIVQGSMAEEEWDETTLKMDTFKSCVVSDDADGNSP